MSDDLEDLKRRLVVGHKSDGRSVYDESAKAELVALCMQPDASVSRLARECGVNANQVGRWLREHGQGRRRRTAVASAPPMRSPFVAVPVLPAPASPVVQDVGVAAAMSLQARLPNGVVVDLGGLDPRYVGEVIEALGRLRCSVLTKA